MNLNHLVSYEETFSCSLSFFASHLHEPCSDFLSASDSLVDEFMSYRIRIMHIISKISLVIQIFSHAWLYQKTHLLIIGFFSQFYNSRKEPNFEKWVSDVHSLHSCDLGKTFFRIEMMLRCWERVADLNGD